MAVSSLSLLVSLIAVAAATTTMTDFVTLTPSNEITDIIPPPAVSTALASYGSGMSSITPGPPRTVVDCAGSPRPFDQSYSSTTFCLASSTTSTLHSTTTKVSSTAMIEQAPTTNYSSLSQCFHNPGGVQSDGTIKSGCGGMLNHINTCYKSLSPWVNPYDTTQSTAFQTCLCETSSSTPFTQSSVLWRNYTGCSACLQLYAATSVATLSIELERIENFCSTREPLAYLFIIRLIGWLGSLHKNTRLDNPPLTGNITLIGTLQPKFTTTPPLANIAWGASATAFGGSLAGVSPSLIIETYDIGDIKSAVTSLYTWIPTATSAPTFDAKSAASAAESNIGSQLNAAASTMVAAGPQQGGPSQVCHGKCSSGYENAVTVWLLVTAFVFSVVVSL